MSAADNPASSRERALFSRFPALADRVSHVSLATLPTAVEPLALDALPAGTRVFIKRDDLTGDTYGGNKVRKLEFLLGEALTQGCREVWTVGAIGSHHALATTLYARKLGLAVKVLHFPQPVTEHVRRNLRAIAAAGAELVLAERNAVPAAIVRRHVRDWLTRKSVRSRFIPAGGSSEIGALGYVEAALELVAQVEHGELPRPDVIYVTAGTCGTLAGLHAGFALAGWDALQLVGVRVVDKLLSSPRVVRKLSAAALAQLVANGASVPAGAGPHVRFDHRFYGPGYGVPTPEALSARAQLAGVPGAPPLEPTYTARTMAALLNDLARGRARGNVLYWHTFSSRPLDALVDAVEPEAMPEPYRRFFDGPVEA